MLKPKKLIVITLIISLLFSCKNKEVKPIEKIESKDTIALISVKDSKFYKGENSYYFVGTNYWYGPLIGAKNIGDRERLINELDLMKSVPSSLLQPTCTQVILLENTWLTYVT